ncbi:OPT oligopeptide transporter protein-domain-containing protein [Boletus edulis]|nr:OPT oligopeptide transporter protein-domain-containing protein [Boletus edulis]
MGNNFSDVQPDGYPTTAPSFSDAKLSEKDEKLLHKGRHDASGIVLHSEREIAAHVVSVDDDPSLNPWTFRAFSLGLGLSAFGSSLGITAEIYYFKPQVFLVSVMFLAIISYILGLAMETFIPRRGLFPSFQQKENTFIIVMASAAANSALATEILAVQRLYYNVTPDATTSIFLLFSSQLLGYGIGGILRRSEYSILSSERSVFLWELFPEWIFPLLAGYLGSNGNEGLGLLSICLDWQYISGPTSPVAIPLKSQLSQLLFYRNGTIYDQLLILNSNYEVDPTLLAEQGLPFYAGTFVVNLISINMGSWSWMSPSNLYKQWKEFTWNSVEWKFWNNNGMRKQPMGNEDIDPHYAQMLKYPDTPNSWYYITFVVSFIGALVVIYKSDSTLPWWGFVIAVLLAVIFILFHGALYAITGVTLSIQTVVQMIAGYLNPGKPIANMYFVLYSYSKFTSNVGLLGNTAINKDSYVIKDTKLPPRAAFTAQIIGTLLGAVLNYFLMNSIIDNHRDVLLSVQGTNMWSGAQPQAYNSQAIAWGGLSHELFSAGMRYQWVPWSYLVGLAAPVPFWLVHRYWPKLRADYLYIPVICQLIGWLSGGITSMVLSFFAVALASQWWIRTRHPRWFQKYNYPSSVRVSLDGGTQVMVFILSFAVNGLAGKAHLFPAWWGGESRWNYDHCLNLG